MRDRDADLCLLSPQQRGVFGKVRSLGEAIHGIGSRFRPVLPRWVAASFDQRVVCHNDRRAVGLEGRLPLFELLARVEQENPEAALQAVDAQGVGVDVHMHLRDN